MGSEKAIIKETIVEVLEKLGKKADRVILFGSRAEGKSREESDWDILIVLKGSLDARERKDLWYEIYRALHGRFRGHSFDVIINTQEVFDREKVVVNTVANEAYSKGVEL